MRFIACTVPWRARLPLRMPTGTGRVECACGADVCGACRDAAGTAWCECELYGSRRGQCVDVGWSVTISVDPDTYQSASRVFGDQFTSDVGDLLSTLLSSLADIGGCSGNDEGSVAFADSYDQAAQSAGQTVSELADAGTTVASLLQQSGFNHARADAHSNIDGDDLVDTKVYQPAPPQSIAMASLHGGGLFESPDGWEWVAAPFGGVWPDGDPGKLRQVAAAWKTAAGSLDGLWDAVGNGMSALEGQQSPELEQARIVCRSLGEAATVLAEQCRAIGDAVVAHADQIEKGSRRGYERTRAVRCGDRRY